MSVSSRTAIALAALSVLVTVGCGDEPDGSLSSSGAAPPVAQAWRAPYQGSTTPGAMVTAVSAPTGGQLLFGESNGAVNAVGADGTVSPRGSLGGSVSSFAVSGTRVFAASADWLLPNLDLGVVYEWTGSAWETSLENTGDGAVVAALDGRAYAFTSTWDTPSPVTVSWLQGSTWSDVAALPSAVATCAAAGDGELWVGGSAAMGAGGSAKLFRGSGGQWSEVSLPANPIGSNLTQEVVTTLLVAEGNLFVGLLTLDEGANVTVGGRLLIWGEGENGFRELTQFEIDAPQALGWQNGQLVMGTLAGRVFEGRPEFLIQDRGMPSNTGVFALGVLDNQTLAVGVRGTASAELLVRGAFGAPAAPTGNTTPTVPSNSPTVPAPNTGPTVPTVPTVPAPTNPTPALTYAGDAKPILLEANCAGCHSDPANGANAAFPLSADLANDSADLTQIRLRVNSNNPGLSLLTQKASGQVAHGGGTVIAQGSAQYNTLLSWIGGGAN